MQFSKETENWIFASIVSCLILTNTEVFFKWHLRERKHLDRIIERSLTSVFSKNVYVSE